VRESIAKKIYVKNTQRSRREVGLETWSDWIYGEGDTRTFIDEDEARFIVDIENGQKTGFFLDQRMNRLETRLYSRGTAILDLFSYTCGFGIQSLLGGGRKAVFVEEDRGAVRLLQENIKLNKLEDRAEIYNMRVEKFFQENNLKYDIVVSDPPAFIQSREGIRSGLSKYRRVLSNILDVLSRDSILFYSSCSYFLKPNIFLRLLDNELSRHKHRYVYLGRIRGASPDHVNSGEDELNYLKALFVRII
jgi:23S rRNA (cytosine1962-C5)-methyltransferase